MNVIRWLILAVFIVAFAWQCEQFIQHNSPTYDEAVHVTAGHSYWSRFDFRLNYEDPPLVKLFWTLPSRLYNPPPFEPDPVAWQKNDEWNMGNRFTFVNDRSWQEIIYPARRMNVLLGIGVIVVVSTWTFRLTGNRLASLISPGLVAFDPNFVAHSAILSTDVGLAFFALLASERAWTYWHRQTNFNLYSWGIFTGLMLATKFSAIAVLAAWVVTAAAGLIRGGCLTLPGAGQTTPDTLTARIRSAIPLVIRLLIIAFVTLAFAYFVFGVPMWIRGLLFQLMRGKFGNPSFYLNGQISHQGWFEYFPIILALKLPLGTHALFVLGVCISGWIVVRRTTPSRRSGIVWIIVFTSILGLLLCISRINLGGRVVLVLLPFLYFLMSCAVSANRFLSVIALLCVAWNAGSCLRSAPYPLSYVHELVGSSHQGCKIIGDSNIDWGQGLLALKEYMNREQLDLIYLSYFGTAEPRWFGIHYHPLVSEPKLVLPPYDRIKADAKRHVVAVSATNLQGIYLERKDAFAFLMSRKPTAIVAGSIFIWDLTDDPEALRQVRGLTP